MASPIDTPQDKGEYKANIDMSTASAIRLQIEAALAHRIPSALTPAPKAIRPVRSTGVEAVDALLEGGLPIGAITEMAGPECSGRTSLALSLLAGIGRAGGVVAWIDVSDGLHPESAAAAGVELSRLLWVRCGAGGERAVERSATGEAFRLPEKYWIAAPATQGLHWGGCGGHPRMEMRGLAEAVHGLLQEDGIAPRCAETQRRARSVPEEIPTTRVPLVPATRPESRVARPWMRMEQALRVADLLLQGGGFGAIVLDMASIAREHALRVPLATWFRYRAAAERTQSILLLLTQDSCAKSSAELLLRFEPGKPLDDEATVFSGIEHRLEVERRRFMQVATNVIPMRKPPQRADGAQWSSRSAWASPR